MSIAALFKCFVPKFHNKKIEYQVKHDAAGHQKNAAQEDSKLMTLLEILQSTEGNDQAKEKRMSVEDAINSSTRLDEDLATYKKAILEGDARVILKMIDYSMIDMGITDKDGNNPLHMSLHGLKSLTIPTTPSDISHYTSTIYKFLNSIETLLKSEVADLISIPNNAGEIFHDSFIEWAKKNTPHLRNEIEYKCDEIIYAMENSHIGHDLVVPLGVTSAHSSFSLDGYENDV